MSRFSTLNFLINSYNSGKKEFDFFQNLETVSEKAMNSDFAGFEPSQESLNAILNFALQFEVLKSKNTGTIELNLNWN